MKPLVLASVLLLLVSSLHADPRLWGDTGSLLFADLRLQWSGSAAQDADGNVLVVWTDNRTGDPNLYAQLLSPTGEQLWDSGGRCVVHFPATQAQPAVAAAHDGWIIAWVDCRHRCGYDEEGYITMADIWAQKISRWGQLLWPDNEFTGVQIDNASWAIYGGSLRVVDDGSGGAFIGWVAYSEAGGLYRYDIYAQRVGSTGALLWPARVLLTPSAGQSWVWTAVAGVSGTMIGACIDRPHTDPRLLMTKVNSDGSLPWGADGRLMASGSLRNEIGLCSDNQNGAYVTWLWRDSAGTDVLYGQRVSPDGDPLWGDSTLVFCDASGWKNGVRMAPSAVGGMPDGFIVGWGDGRGFPHIVSAYAQKVTPDGQTLWAANGIPLYTDPDPYNTNVVSSLVSDNAGGAAIVVSTGGYLMTRVDALGSPVWTPNCVPTVYGLNQYSSRPFRGQNCFLMLCFNECGANDERVVYQQFDAASGGRSRPDSGEIIVADQSPFRWWTDNPGAVDLTDGRTGLVWPDPSGGLRFQSLREDGSLEQDQNGRLLFPPDSVADLGNAFRLCPDGEGGFFCFYHRPLADYFSQLRLTRFNGQGDPLCGLGTVVFFGSYLWDIQSMNLVPDGENGCFITWLEYYSSPARDTLKVLRFDAACEPVWPAPVTIAQVPTTRQILHLQAESDGSCLIVLDEGTSAGNYWNSLWVARINAAGVLWMSQVADSLDGPSIRAVSDGHDGLFLSWEWRPLQSWVTDLKVQHVNGDGSPLWQTGGVIINDLDQAAWYADLIPDSAGGVYAIWLDDRDNWVTDVYAQHFNMQGQAMWLHDGRPLCSGHENRWDMRSMSDRNGDLLTIWGASDGVRGMYLHPDGSTVDSWWTPERGGLVAALGDQQSLSFPALMTSGADRAFLCFVSHSYAAVWGQMLSLIPGSAVPAPTAGLPTAYRLDGNYPNPFNPRTIITFALPRSGETHLSVYDLLGRKVTDLVNGPLKAGEHRITFDASDLSSGVYFYRLESGPFSQSRKMVVLK
jgi:hypothetical protein